MNEDGDYELYKVVKLKNNDSILEEVPLGGEKGTDPITYYIMETDAQGNPVDTEVFAYEISGEGSVSFDKDHTSDTISIINSLKSQKAELTFKKVDEKNIGLAGAKFQLTNKDGSYTEEWESDEDSYVMILEPGTYTLEELEAPEGYIGGDKVVITVGEDNKITVDGSVDVTFTNNIMTYKNQPKNKVTPTPTPGTPGGGGSGTGTYGSGKAAVKTGDDTPIALYLLALLLAAGLIGLIVLKKKKGDNKK